MRTFLAGLVIGVLAFPAFGYLFIRMGGIPMGTQNGPLPLERKLAHLALNASMGSDVDRESPLPQDAANQVSGAHVYVNHCAGCHGLPDQSKPPEIASGLFPRAPQLMPPKKGVTDDSIGETFWKVKNGIRLTGMPAFEHSLSDTEMWQVSALLLHAGELSPEALNTLRANNP